MLSSPLIGSAAFMALNYMWVVSAGRKARPTSEREISACERIVSEIGERGQDRDDRQATRSVATTSRPSNPTPPLRCHCLRLDWASQLGRCGGGSLLHLTG